MLLHIPNVLTPAQVAGFRARLDAAQWIDGRQTVGHLGAQAKRNEQLPEDSPLRRLPVRPPTASETRAWPETAAWVEPPLMVGVSCLASSARSAGVALAKAWKIGSFSSMNESM